MARTKASDGQRTATAEPAASPTTEALAASDTAAPIAVSGITLEIPVGDIYPSPFNPRKHFDEADLISLGESLRAHGQLQNVVVRPGEGGRFELAAGERRWRAAKRVGLPTLRAEVRQLDDVAFVEIVNIENLQRSDLHPLEEARGFRSLMEVAGYKVPQLATRFKRGETYVYDALKLLQLTPFAQDCFRANRFTKDHAILISRLPASVQDQLVGTNAKDVDIDLPPLWQQDEGLFSREQLDSEADVDEAPLESVAPITVKALKKWIDQHVRFTLDEDVAPALFPTTVEAVAEAEVANVKVVEITEEHYVQPEARTDKEIIGPRSWKRADGERNSVSCEFAVLGLVVAGPGRGKAFKVCIAKHKCSAHWKEEVEAFKAREKAKANAPAASLAKGPSASQLEKQRAKEAAAELERRVEAETAAAVLEALTEKFGQLRIAATGEIATELLSFTENNCWFSDEGETALEALVPTVKTADDLLRKIVAMVLLDDDGERNPKMQGAVLKALKIDRKAIETKVRKAVEATASLVCQHCGCSEAKACKLPNGEPCSWHTTTPPVCSAAACVKASKKASTMAAASVTPKSVKQGTTMKKAPKGKARR